MEIGILSFAQISDCHLYGDKAALHYGVNVYENFCLVLEQIKNNSVIEFIVFTGDLSQDHSERSYQNFADAVQSANITIPIYFLAGNHDEITLLDKYLSLSPFQSTKTITHAKWQIQLVNSKSATPSGFISYKESERLLTMVEPNMHQIILMHHHPVNVGYFIDKHGLINKADFYQTLNKMSTIRAVACGHIHNAIDLPIDTGEKNIPLFTCPATSIQFKQSSSLENSGKPAGFRIFKLHNNGLVNSQVTFIR